MKGKRIFILFSPLFLPKRSTSVLENGVGWGHWKVADCVILARLEFWWHTPFLLTRTNQKGLARSFQAFLCSAVNIALRLERGHSWLIRRVLPILLRDCFGNLCPRFSDALKMDEMGESTLPVRGVHIPRNHENAWGQGFLYHDDSKFHHQSSAI